MWWIPLLAAAAQAKGSQDQAQDRSLTLQDEADSAEQNAIIAQQAGKYNAERIRVNSQKTIGAIEADYAASGVSLDSVSALEVLRESHTNAELDRQNTLFAADARYNDLKNRASNARAGAKSARSAGQLSAFTALFKGGADSYSKSGGSS